MMPREHFLTTVVPEPLALIAATLDFASQVMIAQHPELLRAPEEVCVRRPPTAERAARHVIDAVNELYYAVEIYRAYLVGNDEDIPF
jgi:hypothetical protein